MRELARIPDKKDAVRVAVKVLKAIEHSEKEAAKNGDARSAEKKGRPKLLRLTAPTVRKFVDEELGLRRSVDQARRIAAALTLEQLDAGGDDRPGSSPSVRD